MRNIALDLGKRKTTFCQVLDGQVVARGTVGRVQHLERLLGPRAAPARVAIESCRDAWFVHDLVASWGNEVIVVDTTRARQLGIGQHGRKTDRVDAEVLAMALEQGRIPVAHVLSEPRRRLRELTCLRRMLLKTRSQYVAQIRALLQARGVTVPSCAAHDFATRLQRSALPAELDALVVPLSALLPPLQVQIAEVEERIHQLCEGDDVVQRLATVPGVAILTAVAFVSVIDDAGRFRRAGQVASYLGLVPIESSTGGKRKLGSISKQGNGHVRATLVQAAWTVLRSRSGDPLTRWAQALAERRGKRIAVVAVARRLARLMWAIWRDGTFYDPDELATHIATGLRKQAQSTETRARVLLQARRKLEGQRRQSARRAERARALLSVEVTE